MSNLCHQNTLIWKGTLMAVDPLGRQLYCWCSNGLVGTVLAIQSSQGIPDTLIYLTLLEQVEVVLELKQAFLCS